LALSPPLGFLPSLRCHAAVLAIIYQVCLDRRLLGGCIVKDFHQRVDQNVPVEAKFLELYFLNLMFLFLFSYICFGHTLLSESCRLVLEYHFFAIWPLLAFWFGVFKNFA